MTTNSAAHPAQPAPPGGILRVLLDLPRWIYRAGLGRLLGHRFLLLVAAGRKSGQVRQTVVEVVHYDAATRESVVAAGWGRRTQWLLNIEAGGLREIRTAGRTYVPQYRLLPVDEAARVFADYERRNRLIRPIVRAVISRLVGWRYDGSPEARRRVVEQLVLVGFRPAA